MKKLFASLITLIISFSVFGVIAHAESYDDVLEYEIVYGHAVITHCNTSAEGYITIPSYINGLEVAEIGNNAFAGCTGITHIDMKHTNITKIGDAAFEGCTSLYGVYLSDYINYISVNAFLNCMSLSYIDISDLSVWCGIEFYDMYSNPLYYGGTLYISGTEIKDIVIPDGVAEIKNYAFYGMDIDSLTIPPSLKKVGASIISEFCRIDLKVPSLEQICSIEYNNWNCLGRINDLYVDGVKTTDIIFPEGVTHIPERLFSEFSSLTSVTFPETVLSIGESAFYYCPNLQKVVIEGSETVVAAYAFLSCTLLDTIIIPETAEFVGYNAFYNTMWYNSQPDGCIYIGNWLCGYKGNTSYVSLLAIKDGTIGISPMFFSYGEGKDDETLTTLYIPDSLEYIGNNAFEGCLDLKNIEFGNGIKYVGTHAFYNTAWYDSLSDGATYIGNILYKYKDDTANTQFDIRNGTTIIANGAFENCENLVTVTMTDSVTDIGDYAFAGCINLENISLSNNLTRINESVFGSCTSLSSIKLPDSIESIGECAFYCSGLKSITLPDSIRTIENDAYASCDNLSGTIVIPDGVTYIGNAFRYSYIDTIKIPDSVNYIGNEAFFGCNYLSYISISNEAYNRLAPSGCFETISNAQFGRIITYMLDGEVYKTQVVPENTNVTLPEPENGYQYKFYVDGKEYNGEGVTEDTTVEIQRTAIVYVYFWGDFTQSQTVPVGGDAVLPENPEDGYYTYTVSGSAWDGKNITSEVSVKVTKHLNQYTITYIFEDGTKQKETVTHGENALYPDFPEGCYYTYATESGSEWTGENITSDIEVYATEHPYVYTVTYIFGDRTEQTFLVNHGEDAPLLENPADGYYTYITYDGSDWTGKNITSNVKVLASKHLNVYTVTITFEDGSYQKINVTHGSSIQLPENPSYGYYTYSTSDGKAWDGTNITSDTKVYVTLHINVYRITYTFDDGTTETFYVNHGENAPFPQAVYDGQYTCIMSDGSIWTGKYVEADADILVTKQFNKYIVTYTGDYENSAKVTHGKNTVLPTNPADGYYTYTTQDGAEWNGENITSDVTVIVTKHLNIYTVTFTGDYDESIQVTHGQNAVLPTNPTDGYYTYATEDGTEWTGDNITSDVIVVVTKHLNKYTVTFTGDYDESIQVTHGQNAVLPTNPTDGYYYVYHTSDGAIWTGDNITSDVTVIVTKHLNKYTVTFTGDYDESVQVTHGDNAILPENPYGYHYIYHTSDGAIWTGEDITKDVIVTVTKQINIYTVTFAGDYTGTQEVEHGNDVVIPQSPDGYVYTYSANTSNVTSDRTVFLELLCDMAELTVSGLEYTFYDGNIIRGEYYDMWYDISNMSVSPGAVLKFIGYSDGGIVLKKGENIIAVTVVAESGKKQDYCLIINRNLPDSLGKLVFREAIGGTATLELPQGIKGNPEIKVSCTYTEIEIGDDTSGESFPGLVDKVALLDCVFNKDNNTVFVSSLLENTEYKFVVIASYEDVIIESQPVWATTGELKSTDCSITSVISPNGGTIDEGADGEMGSIFIRYYHDMGDNVKINVTVSEGATWDLYYGPTSSMTYTDKIITGIKPGMTKTAYIKVVSEAGEEHTKTYVVYVYRQTKSAKPEICVTNGMVSITSEAENVQIKYTIDGKSPGEQEGIVYTAPFEAPDGAVIRAVAKEAEKDETSDVAIYVVDKKPKAHITEISWYSQDKKHYEYEFYIDSMKSDTGIVIVAVYDEGHIMTGIDFSEFKCTNGEAIASGTVTTSSNGSWCKVFVINSLSDIKPLSDVLVRDTLS